MLYLGIDQHKAQITINLRNEHGDVIQQRQVSTNHAKIDDFFVKLKQQSTEAGGYMAILEVCGFNHWLIQKLVDYGCQEIVLMQPEKTSNKKTDRRDANNLCELLWNNNKRIKNGERPNGIRRVVWPTPEDADVRQLASLRRHLVRHRSKCIIKIRGCLRKHNLEQDCPSKHYTTKKAGEWLKTLELPATDRLEIDVLLVVWKTLNAELLKVEIELAKRVETDKNVLLLVSIPGITHLGAGTLLSRIGNIERFPTPDSLANYFGLTPGCRNSGEKTQQHTPITKAGSSLARSILSTAVDHVVRKDKAMKDWHKGIKKRKGTKTARVAVMRRLATITWHILKRQTTYQFHYDPIATSQPKTKSPQKSGVGFPRHSSGVQCTCQQSQSQQSQKNLPKKQHSTRGKVP